MSNVSEIPEDDGWHVLNCDGCGSPKSVEPEQKQYLCGDCIRAYFDENPSRLSTTHKGK